jgi:hypothetical protein
VRIDIDNGVVITSSIANEAMDDSLALAARRLPPSRHRAMISRVIVAEKALDRLDGCLA